MSLPSLFQAPVHTIHGRVHYGTLKSVLNEASSIICAIDSAKGEFDTNWMFIIGANLQYRF